MLKMFLKIIVKGTFKLKTKKQKQKQINDFLMSVFNFSIFMEMAPILLI